MRCVSKSGLFRPWRLASCLLLALATTFAQPAGAQEAGSIEIENAWVRATIGEARTTAAYVTIKNAGGEADRLLEAASEAAATVELHTHVRDGDIVRMRRVEGGVEAPAGGEAAMAPGGLHIMLIGVSRPLAEGERASLTLVFERAGRIEVDAPVLRQAPGADARPDGHDHGPHGHGGH